MNPTRLIPVLTLAAGLLTSHASASIIASDTFNYTAGSLGTANGGTGWTSSWAGGSTNVTSPGLTLGGVGVGDNKLTTNNDNNGAFRSLAPQGTDGTTVWLGYLTSNTGAPVSAGYSGLSLFQDGTENVFTGKRSVQTVWGVERSGGSSGDSTVSADTATHYLVYKIEFGAGTTAGNEKITMWIDPTPGLASPNNSAVATLTDVTNFTFNRIRLQSGNGSSFNADEVRIGTTFADVPEPAAIVSLAVGAAALLVRRRRKS